MSSSVVTRVYREVRDLYKELSNDAGVIMCDLISLTLLHAAQNQYLMTYILQEEFDLRYSAARELAFKLSKKAKEILSAYEVLSSAEKEEIFEK